MTHERPHLDEIVAIFLVRQFMANLPVQFLPNGNQGMEFAPEVMPIGIGGGMFDEHPGEDGRKEEECAATLVAKWLGISERPELKRLLEYTKKDDLRGANGDILSISTRTKTMYGRKDQTEVVEWALVAIEDYYLDQVRFFSSNFKRDACVKNVQVGDKTVQFASIVSNERVGDIARSNGIALLIQKSETGVQIFSHFSSKMRLSDLARVLRIEENSFSNNLKNDWKRFETEEKVDGLPEWYMHPKGVFLLNGSKTATGVPKTKIAIERILELAILTFSEAEYRKCKIENPLACKKCPFAVFKYGMRICRKKRHDLNPESEAVRAA